MAYSSEDDWLNFSLNDLSKVDSPPPGFFENIENIQIDDNAASPMRDLDVGYSADLAVPLGDFQYSDPQNGGPSQIYQNMHTMQAGNNYDMQASTSGNMDYNPFEVPQVVHNGNMEVETYTDLNVDHSNSFYSNQQPSTSDQHQMQMIGSNGYGQPQQQQQQQQHLMQMQPSTSYMQTVDGSMQGGISTDQQMMMQLQQPTNQQQQQQPLQQQQQQQQQPQPQQPPPKPTPKKKAPSRKKQPAPNNSVGAVLSTAQKMSQQMNGGAGGGTDGKTRCETRMTAEESMKIGQLMAKMSELQSQKGVDNTAQLNTIHAEIAAIFANNLSSTGGNSAIVNEIQSSLTAPAQQQQQPQQQQQQQQQKQQQTQQLHHMQQPAPPAKKAAPKRNRNNTPKIAPPKIDTTPQATIIPANRYGPPDSPTYQPQMVYQQNNMQQDILQTMPSTSSAQYMDYTQNSQIQIVQQGMSQQQTKIPSMNSRQHVYRQQVVYQQSGSSTPQQQSQQFQGQQVYVQQQGQPILIQSEPTLGDVVKQQQQQLRFQNQQDSALRQQLLNSTSSSSTPPIKQQSRGGGNNRRVSLNSSQPATPQQQVQMQPSPMATQHMQTITVTRENSNMFPNVPIGSVLQILPSNQMPQQQQQQRVQYDSSAMFEEPKEQVVMIPETTPEELAEIAERKRVERTAKLRNLLDEQCDSMESPRFAPFENLRDVVKRLLPYHLHYEPDVSQQAFDDFDENWFRHNINVEKKKKYLESRIQEITLQSTFQHSDRAEGNMLLFLETERTRRALVKDKEAAARNLEEFVGQSEIVFNYRNGLPMEQMSGVTKREEKGPATYGDYEYHDFDENFVRVASPYVSPVLSPIFSPKKRSSSRKDSASSSFSLQSPPPPMFASPVSIPSSSSTAEPMAPKTLITEDIESEATKPDPEADRPVAAKNSVDEVDEESSARRLPSKKEFLTRARKDVPAALRSPPAQSVSIRNRLASTSRAVDSPPPPKQMNASSTAETFEDSEGSGSPELGIDDDDIYIRPPPPSACLSAAKKERLAEEKSKRKENTTPPLPPIKICVPNPAKHEPIKLKFKLPPKTAPLEEIYIKKEIIEDVVVEEKQEEEEQKPMIKMTIKLAKNKRKSLEKEELTPMKKSRVEPVTPIAQEEKPQCSKNVDNFKTPVNGVKNDRIAYVMTDDIGGRIKMRIRKVPENLLDAVTPRNPKQKSLEPTPKTRLRMKIQRSAGQYSINFKEAKAPVPISRPANRANSGRAMAIRSDQMKIRLASEKKMKKKKEAMTVTPKVVKPNSFTNRFNPFASIPSTSTMSPRTPAMFLSATPEITNGPKNNVIATPPEPKPVLKSPNRKISALLPWMTDEPAKKPEKKPNVVVKIEPLEPTTQQECVPSTSSEPVMPTRASSSMAFLLDDDKTNVDLSFLHSPQRKAEPLPIVDFSDDDDDNDIHTDFSLATERIMAMSTSSGAAPGSDPSYP